MVVVRCPHCNKEHSVQQYRLKTVPNPCCSYSCSARWKVAKIFNIGEQTRTPADVIGRVKELYEGCSLPVNEIALKCGVSRDVVFRYAKARKWSRFKREHSVRLKYRLAAKEAIGRDLSKGEHVHHIDGDCKNNTPSNLVVFPGPMEHAECHGTLMRCAFRLVRSGKISFSREKKRYTIPK